MHRAELIEAFCESRYLNYWKLAMKTITEAKKEIEGREDLSAEDKKSELEKRNKVAEVCELFS